MSRVAATLTTSGAAQTAASGDVEVGATTEATVMAVSTASSGHLRDVFGDVHGGLTTPDLVTSCC